MRILNSHVDMILQYPIYCLEHKIGGKYRFLKILLMKISNFNVKGNHAKTVMII